MTPIVNLAEYIPQIIITIVGVGILTIVIGVVINCMAYLSRSSFPVLNESSNEMSLGSSNESLVSRTAVTSKLSYATATQRKKEKKKEKKQNHKTAAQNHDIAGTSSEPVICDAIKTLPDSKRTLSPDQSLPLNNYVELPSRKAEVKAKSSPSSKQTLNSGFGSSDFPELNPSSTSVRTSALELSNHSESNAIKNRSKKGTL